MNAFLDLDPATLAIGFAAGAFVAAILCSAIGLPRLRRLERATLRAETRAETLEENQRAQREFTERHLRIEELIRPLHENVERYQREARELAAKREHDTGRMSETLRQLSLETQKLGETLRAPQARGRWGELTLRRTAELAGLSAHCDFTEQRALGDGRLRPDMVVHLPGGREIVVDAKVPLTAYLEAVERRTPEERTKQLELHARHLRRHIDSLSSKNYTTLLDTTLEFVVLFLPNDGFLSAAAEKDPGIVEYALGRQVVLATPATFFALLIAIAQGWKQERLSENATQLWELGQQMHERLATFTEHLNRVGENLERSVEHYNAALGSFSARVLPHARKLEELGAEGRKPLAAPASLTTRPRPHRNSDPAASPATEPEA